MISKYSHKELNWIDLESPKEEEIAYILEEYAIPLFIKDEIILKSKDDVIRLDHGFIFSSISIPQAPSEKNSNDKLIFVVSDNFIITIHDRPMQSLNEFLKEMELSAIGGENFNINNNRLLFAHLLKSLYVNSQKQLISDGLKIKDLKKQIESGGKNLKLLTVLSLVSLVGTILISLYVISHL